MDEALINLCDRFEDQQITVEEFQEQLWLRRARLNEEHRRKKEQEGEAQHSP